MACTLKNLLQSVLRCSSEDAWRVRLAKQWSTIIGDLHSKMRLERVRNSTLIVGVYDSHWMHELFMLSDVIVSTINEQLGGEYVTQIRFVLASAEKKEKEKKTTEQPRQKLRSTSLNSNQKTALKAIKDDQLQTLLEQFLHRCQA